MGNICALDMGIVILRISIFDKQNKMFPFKIWRHMQENDNS